MQVEQEKHKNKKLVTDFEEMTSVIKEGESDSKAINESGMQALMLKNQKLEGKIRDLEGVRRESAELK